MKLVVRLKCLFGLHLWGAIEKQEVNITGPHILFMSWGEQDGRRTCTICGCVQNLRRSGFVGIGCNEPKWKKCKI